MWFTLLAELPIGYLKCQQQQWEHQDSVTSGTLSNIPVSNPLDPNWYPNLHFANGENQRIISLFGCFFLFNMMMKPIENTLDLLIKPPIDSTIQSWHSTITVDFPVRTSTNCHQLINCQRLPAVGRVLHIKALLLFMGFSQVVTWDGTDSLALGLSPEAPLTMMVCTKGCWQLKQTCTAYRYLDSSFIPPIIENAWTWWLNIPWWHGQKDTIAVIYHPI